MGEEKPQEAVGREEAVPWNPSLTPRSCPGALMLLKNLYRQKTGACKKSLALGPQGEWKDRVKGLGTPGASSCVLGPMVCCSNQHGSHFWKNWIPGSSKTCYISALGDLATK